MTWKVYCPLCGRLLFLDLDGHFVSCLLRHAIAVYIGPHRIW